MRMTNKEEFEIKNILKLGGIMKRIELLLDQKIIIILLILKMKPITYLQF